MTPDKNSTSDSELLWVVVDDYGGTRSNCFDTREEAEQEMKRMTASNPNGYYSVDLRKP